MTGLANSVRRLRFALIAGSLLLALPLQAQDFAWARGLGGALDDLASDVTTDAAGNVYVTGFFGGTVDFDPGTGVANLTSVDTGDVFVLKFDSAGSFVWARRMGGANADSANSVVVDAAGNVYTTGWFEGTADFDPGPGVAYLTATGEPNPFSNNTSISSNAFISKLNSAGNFVWAKVLNGSGYSEGTGVTVDAAGNVYTTGFFSKTADFDPGSGVANLSCSGSADVFVLKLDRAGSFVWARRMGGPYYATGVGVTVDAAGNVYTTGYFEGTADFDPGADVANLTSAGDHGAFISKLDPDGNFVWAKVLSGSGYSAGWGVAVDAAGNVYTAGFFLGPVDFDPGPSAAILTPADNEDVYVSKLDSGGSFVWARHMGGPAYDRTFSLALDAGGNIYTTGLFDGTADFDPGDGIFNLTTTGDSDIFVLKLSGDPGDLQPVITSGGIVVANLSPAINTVSPLSVISVFGQNFSTETILYPDLTGDGKISTSLGDACLMMNGEALPLFAVTPGQINAQVSANKAYGPARFTVVANCGSASALTSAPLSLALPAPRNLTSGVETVTVEDATPAFFIFNPVASDGFIAARFNATESQPAVAVAPVGMFNDQYGPSRPANPGDIILLYGTGWGETTAGLTTGELATAAAQLLLDEANPKITLGGVQLAAEDLIYVGVTPGTAGLYQAAIRIPANAQAGNQQVVLTVYGKSTPVGPVIPIALP